MENKYVKATFCLASVAIALPGAAQDAEQLTPLEEIVITAERREQRLQDVPLSVTAFGEEKRDLVGILSIQDMANFTPGLSYNTSTDRPSIRGVARQSNTFSLDSPVANYIDGVYTSSVQDAQRGPMFVERTEILRGPQGALSGRGSVAGSINTHLRRPSEAFEAEVRTFAENYDAYGAGATVSGPFTGWLRGRLNLVYTRQDEGYFENVATGETEGNQPNNRQTADYMIEADLGENVDLYVKASFTEYDESRRSGGSFAPYVADVHGRAPTPYGHLGSPLTPTAYYGYFEEDATQLGSFTQNPVIVTGDLRKYSNNFESRQWLDDHHNYTMHLNWYTDLFDVKWIAGHQNYRYTQQTDGDGTAITSMPIPNAFGGTRIVDPSAMNQYMEQREWYSNEITLTSHSDGDFQWIVGVYHSNEDYLQQPFTLTHFGYPELAAPNGAPANQRGNASVFGQVDGETVSSALFGQIEYQWADAWKFTLGLRQNSDDKDVQEQTRYVANNVGAGIFLAGLGSAVDVTPAPSLNTPDDPWPTGVRSDYIDPVSGNRVRDLDGEWDALTGTFGIDYTPLDDVLIYFRMASGYRPGGFDVGFLPAVPQVDEEVLTSYELGYKATLMDTLQLSTSAFYYDFQDQQLDLPTLGRCTDPDDLNTCTIVSNFFNVPESESKGVEIELGWFPTDSLAFNLSYGYLDATIKEGLINGQGFQNPEDPAAILPNANRYQPIPGQSDAGYTNLPRWLQDLSGNKLANSPEHKVAFNANYTFSLNAGNFTVSANYVWRDDSYSDVFETEPGTIEGFKAVDLRLIWSAIDDRYTVIAYGSNIFDEDAQDGGGLTRQATASSWAAGQRYYRTFNLIPPRTYGLELQYRFGS